MKRYDIGMIEDSEGLYVLYTDASALESRVRELDAEVAKIVEIAHEFGWNGVENSKILSTFLRYQLAELARLRAVAEAAKDLRDHLKIIWGGRGWEKISPTSRLAERLDAALSALDGDHIADESKKVVEP